MTAEERQDLIIKRMRENFKPQCVKIIRPVDKLTEGLTYDIARCEKNGMVLEVFVSIIVEGDEFIIEVYPDEFDVLSWIWCGIIPKPLEDKKWRTTLVRRRPGANGKAKTH